VEPEPLVSDELGQRPQRVLELAIVMGAEQQAACGQSHLDVGLRAASVAPIVRGQNIGTGQGVPPTGDCRGGSGSPLVDRVADRAYELLME